MKNPIPKNLNPTYLWIVSLIGGIGGWMMTLRAWSDACTPASLGGLLMILASITATAMGGSLIKPE